MATTIRALLDAAATELADVPTSGPNAEEARDAAGVIAAAGRVLAHLVVDGLDTDRDSPRGQAVTDLVAACEPVGDHGGPAGRATALLGAAGDAIGGLRGDMSAADRWAVALSVAALTRAAVATYTQIGPGLTPVTVLSVRHQATAVARLGVMAPPEPKDLAIQDYPILSTLTAALSPLELSAAAATHLGALVHRAAVRDAPPLRGYEMKATVRAMHALTEYATAFATVLTERDELGPSDTRTSQAWLRVRHDLAVFHDGHRPDPGGPELVLRAAASVHDGLMATFGPPDHLTPATATLDPRHATSLRKVLDQVPLIAEDLTRHTERLPGRLIARAMDLPILETRIEAVLNRKQVMALDVDFAALRGSLGAAGILSSELACAVGSHPALGSGTEEPVLAAAHLVGRFQPDTASMHDNDQVQTRQTGVVVPTVGSHQEAAGPHR